MARRRRVSFPKIRRETAVFGEIAQESHALKITPNASRATERVRAGESPKNPRTAKKIRGHHRDFRARQNFSVP